MKPQPVAATPRSIHLIRAAQEALLATAREDRARRKVIADLCLACVESINKGIDMSEGDELEWAAYLRHPSRGVPSCYQPRLAAPIAMESAGTAPARTRYRRPTAREVLGAIASAAAIVAALWLTYTPAPPVRATTPQVERATPWIMPAEPIDRTIYQRAGSDLPDCLYQEEEVLDPTTLARSDWYVRWWCDGAANGGKSVTRSHVGYAAWRRAIQKGYFLPTQMQEGAKDLMAALDRGHDGGRR